MRLMKRLACWAVGGVLALAGLWVITRFLA
jgi:hypothetical protein